MNNSYVWRTKLDQSVKTGTLWSPEGVEGGFQLRFVNSNENVFEAVELFLQNFDESSEDIITVAHAPEDVMVLYFSRGTETVSVKFSWDEVVGKVKIDGMFVSSKFGLISSFSDGDFSDGFSMAASLV